MNEELKLQRQTFEAKKLTVAKMTASENTTVYVIPPFQRPYRWTKAQVDRLVEDLLDFYEIWRSGKSDQTATEYSLGTIVCDRKRSCFAILDGQQRLTTLDLLLETVAEKRKINYDQHLIASYQYLPGFETELESELPPHDEQKKVIDSVLSKHFENIAEDKVPWEEFEACIRHKVYVTRVTLPLAGGRVKGEAAKMFEIINVSGQKLSLLDQVKARLISVFSEEQKNERAIVSRFWDALPELLAQPKLAAQGFDFSHVNASSENDLLKEETLADVLGNATYADFIKAQKAEKPADQSPDETEDVDKPEQKTSNTEPPIDMGNLLVVANELLRHSMKEDCSEKSNPALTLSYGHFDWLMVEKAKNSKRMPPAEKVLRLIGTANLLLQIVGTWGVYRQRGESLTDVSLVGELTPMQTLQLSFMAENRFRNEAQYWFLMLAANALGRLSDVYLEDRRLCTRSVTPATFQANWSLSAKMLSDIRQQVFNRLTGWAVHRACCPESGAEAAMRWGVMRDEPFQREFDADILSISSKVREWKYGEGLRHWQLYLLDWLLWNDGKEDCPLLQRTLTSFETKNTRVKTALQNFRMPKFKNILRNFSFVRHGAIEHWFPREMARNDNKRLQELNGFGNLALIDTSLNSTLRNLPVDTKAKHVVANEANHSLKLGWLAVFTASFVDYDWKDVQDVTDFWGAYLSGYPFDSLSA